MKVQKEWNIFAPWGKLALVSWGDPMGLPVLLVHGRMDSLSTFEPLLEHLPENYHYVGIDMPGNGKSDAFPIGVKLTRFHFVAAVEVVVKHLNWNQFIYVGHSMGCEQGLFFNAVYPHRIKKLILLDFGPSLQRLQVHDLPEYYKTFYHNYYTNYHMDNFDVKHYTRGEALNAVRRARGLTEEQAEVILSRNLVEVGDGRFRLSWDKRLKFPAPQNYPVEHYYRLFSLNAPPTLLIAASDQASHRPYAKGREAANRVLELLRENVDNFTIVNVEGGHDVHFTNPERLAKHVGDFLGGVGDITPSKL